MFHLILDLETTGIPASRYPHYSDNDGYKNSRIVQVAMILCDSSFNLIDEMNCIIKRDGFSIENSFIHNITNEISDNGLPFVEVLPKIHEFIVNSNTIIAHNIGFDINILLNELYRHDANEMIALIESKQKICTMASTRTIVNAKNKNGHLKNPKLGELYEYCYPDLKFEEKHEAGYDVQALLKILKVIGSAIMNV
jgi:DNA polymerase-3 subunit epsilon